MDKKCLERLAGAYGIQRRERELHVWMGCSCSFATRLMPEEFVQWVDTLRCMLEVEVVIFHLSPAHAYKTFVMDRMSVAGKRWHDFPGEPSDICNLNPRLDGIEIVHDNSTPPRLRTSR